MIDDELHQFIGLLFDTLENLKAFLLTCKSKLLFLLPD